MKNQGLVTLLFLLISVNKAKKFQRCELALRLKNAGLDRYRGISLDNWICFTYHASKFNTWAVSGFNYDGGRHYGIFQINSRWWCARGRADPDYGCHIHCGAFMNDDITDDIACMKTIASNPQRLNTWVGWKKNCKDKNLSHWTKGCKF